MWFIPSKPDIATWGQQPVHNPGFSPGIRSTHPREAIHGHGEAAGTRVSPCWCSDSCPSPSRLCRYRWQRDGRAQDAASPTAGPRASTAGRFSPRFFGIFKALKTRRAEEPPGRGGHLRFPRAQARFSPGAEPSSEAGPRRGRGRPAGSAGGMRLPELCLALLYAAGTGTEPPRAARERPLAPGRGGPGAAPVDPRQAWMLLAGSPGTGSGGRTRGGTGADTAPAGAGSPGKPSSAAPASPRMPEELLRELQLLLRGTGAQGGSCGDSGTRHSRAGQQSREKGRLPS